MCHGRIIFNGLFKEQLAKLLSIKGIPLTASWQSCWWGSQRRRLLPWPPGLHWRPALHGGCVVSEFQRHVFPTIAGAWLPSIHGLRRLSVYSVDLAGVVDPYLWEHYNEPLSLSLHSLRCSSLLLQHLSSSFSLSSLTASLLYVTISTAIATCLLNFGQWSTMALWKFWNIATDYYRPLTPYCGVHSGSPH